MLRTTFTLAGRVRTRTVLLGSVVHVMAGSSLLVASTKTIGPHSPANNQRGRKKMG